MNIQDNQKGFTLIEIIVSLAIFTIVAVVAVGAFLKILDANKKSQTLKTAINNVNFALESITREMRVGDNYVCAGAIGDQVQDGSSDQSLVAPYSGYHCGMVAFYSTIRFENQQCSHNKIYAYAVDTLPSGTLTIKKAEQENCDDVITTDIFAPVISKDAVIENFDLNVFTTSTLSDPQPKVFLYIKGYTGVKEKDKTYFEVQTTVSQRNII